MSSFSSFIPLAPFIAIVTIVIQRNHILISLLALEAIILGLTLLILFSMCFSNPIEIFLALIILTFGACEASLGLACLVSLARSFGNDLISSSSLSKC